MKLAIGRLAALIFILAASLHDTNAASANHSSVPYDKEAKPNSSFGMRHPWKIYLEDGRVYFELGEEDFDRDALVWVRASHRAIGYQLMRWERGEHGVLLRVSREGRENESVNWLATSDVAMTFAASTNSEEGRFVIDATALFVGPKVEAWRFSCHDMRSENVQFHAIESFPENTVVSLSDSAESAQPVSGYVQWNFIALPRQPMRIRKFDPHMPYMYPGHFFFEDEPDVADGDVIVRWRLEEGRSNKFETSINPIKIYIDPRTPDRWKPWVRKGIEAWQGPLEAAGFREAIMSVESSDDDVWNYNDLRRSVVCWETFPGLCGWQIFDPRTGEILQFQIPVNGALSLFMGRYVVTMSAVDPRILEVPMPDEVPGALIQKVTTHEVGHLLGMRDGTFGTAIYTEEQVRDSEWVASNAISPSIMNYSRFNYAAQPDDSMPVELLVQGVGPTDYFSISLGYADPGARNLAGAEEAFVDSLLEQQGSDPLLKYGQYFIGDLNPDNVTDVVAIDDPVRAATLGRQSLQQSIELIESRDFDDIDPEVAALLAPRRLYKAALDQWFLMARHPLSMIGGYVAKPGLNTNLRTRELQRGSAEPVSENDQREAMEYLCDYVFAPLPSFLTNSSFSRHSGLSEVEIKEMLKARRRSVYSSLIRPERLARLVDQGSELAKRPENSLVTEKEYALHNIFMGLEACIVE